MEGEIARILNIQLGAPTLSLYFLFDVKMVNFS